MPIFKQASAEEIARRATVPEKKPVAKKPEFKKEKPKTKGDA